MDTIKKILALIGLITVLILWKTQFPGSWDSFWATIDTMI